MLSSKKRTRDFEQQQDALWYASHEQRLLELLKSDEPAPAHPVPLSLSAHANAPPAAAAS